MWSTEEGEKNVSGVRYFELDLESMEQKVRHMIQSKNPGRPVTMLTSPAN